MLKLCEVLEVHVTLKVSVTDVYFAHGDRASIAIVIVIQFMILI